MTSIKLLMYKIIIVINSPELQLKLKKTNIGSDPLAFQYFVFDVLYVIACYIIILFEIRSLESPHK